jgi:hypothetical protein
VAKRKRETTLPISSRRRPDAELPPPPRCRAVAVVAQLQSVTLTTSQRCHRTPRRCPDDALDALGYFSRRLRCLDTLHCLSAYVTLRRRLEDALKTMTSVVSWCIWKLRNVAYFQGVAWTGLKQLWQRVIPMLLCWRVLVLVKILDGFENAITRLEQVSRRPEMIESARARRVSVRVLGDASNCQSSLIQHFYPP